MKNLHFYIQCLMVLLALSLAVQIPFRNSLAVWVLLIELILAIYQLIMSWMLMTKLSKRSRFLELHFEASLCYLFILLLLALFSPEWMAGWWQFALGVLPWAFIIFFLVTIDGLERIRGYRL